MNITKKEIEKIRAVRRKICAEYGNDPHRMVEYYRKVEREWKAKGFTFVGEKEKAGHAVPANN
jgi:hypothetical protein